MKVTRRAIIATAAGAAVAPSWAGAATAQTYYFMVFNGPVEGQDAEYNNFYDTRHIFDVVSVPGFISGQRFIRNEPQMYLNILPKLPPYLTLYKIVTDDLEKVVAEVARRIQTGETPISPAMDRTIGNSYYFKTASPLQKRSAPPLAEFAGKPMTQYAHIVFTKPVAGKDAEWAEWYDKAHSPDMLSRPGILTAERLTLARPAPTAKIQPTKEAILFMVEMPTDRSVDTPAPPNTPKPTPPPGLATNVQDREATRGYTYRQIGPLVDSATARAKHKSFLAK